jgi:hypothetical protein
MPPMAPASARLHRNSGAQQAAARRTDADRARRRDQRDIVVSGSTPCRT